MTKHFLQLDDVVYLLFISINDKSSLHIKKHNTHLSRLLNLIESLWRIKPNEVDACVLWT